jgi:GT2 family glycosyltransferase
VALPEIAVCETKQVPKLVGILVTFNRPETVVHTVAAIAAQDRALDRLFVVDNSTLDSDAERRCREALGDQAAALTWIRTGKNLGPAGGYALGMERALAESEGRTEEWLVLFDDDDPPPSSTILSEMEASLARSGADALGIVGSSLDRCTGMLRRPHLETVDSYVDVDQIGNGRCPFYSVAAIRQIGPMRSDLFYGREELEFALRIRATGRRVCVDQRLRAKYEDTMGKGVRQPSLRRIEERDRLSRRTMVNHLRILITFVGYRTYTVASLLFLGADVARLPFAIPSRSWRVATKNLYWTLAAVASAARQGKLA